MKSTDGSLWCWGTYGAPGLVPTQEDYMGAPVTHVFALGYENTYPLYIGGDGNTYVGVGGHAAQATASSVKCP